MVKKIQLIRKPGCFQMEDPQLMKRIFNKCSRIADRLKEEGKTKEARKYRLRAARALFWLEKTGNVDILFKLSKK